MSSRRLLKAAEAIRHVVSMAILAEIKDPRVSDVTVTHVEVLPDMREAKVSVSVMGNETKQRLVLRGLQSAAGFLQAKIAERIETRYTPRLRFVLDQGVKRSIQVAGILHEVLPAGSEESGLTEAEPAGSAGTGADRAGVSDVEATGDSENSDDTDSPAAGAPPIVGRLAAGPAPRGDVSDTSKQAEAAGGAAEADRTDHASLRRSDAASTNHPD